MADNTNDDTKPDEQGNNDVSTEGSGGTATPNTEKQVKTLTQEEVNRLVAKAREEGRKSGKDAALKEYEGKQVLTEEDLDKIRKEAAEHALKERDLRDVKKAIQAEYGLNDAQIERISGDDEKSLREDADLLFGALKQKKAPVITPGGTEQVKETAPNQELHDWLKSTTPKTKRF